jgi:hypothetical protein
MRTRPKLDPAKKAIIEAGAADLQVGESTNRTRCPWCNGGTSLAHSFSITRVPHGVLYNCYRSTCSGGVSRGLIRRTGSVLDNVAPDDSGRGARRSLNGYDGDLVALTPDQRERLETAYNLSPAVIRDAGVRWAPDGQRYAIPALHPRGSHLGWALRIPPGVRASPKTLAYPADEGLPWACWYVHPEATALVVVEDPWSAMRVWQDTGLSAVALMGTHASDALIADIARHKSPKVVIALDADATSKAVALGRRTGLVWRNVEVLPLKQDLKDVDTSTKLVRLFSHILGAP